MQKISFILFIFSSFLVTTLVSQPAMASDQVGIGVGGKIGTLGIGGEVAGRIMNNLNLRAGVQGFSYDYDDTYSDINYEANLDLFTTMLVADLFPFSNNFRISGGVMLNNNELTVTGQPTEQTFEIGDVTYPSALVGTLSGTVDFNSVAPYFGLGFGGTFTDDGNLSFMVDVGVLYQGSPNVSYSATGVLANDPGFQANLEKERKELEDDLEDYKYYPVISMGIMYKF